MECDGACPECPECGAQYGLCTVGCEGCKRCVENNLEDMSSDERRALAIRVFELN